MATPQTIHHQTDTGTIDGTAVHLQRQSCPGTACTGDGEDAFILGIQIDQRFALQHAHIYDIGTQHTNLFVHCNDHFQGRMGNALIRQQRHGIGNGNAVVAAQCCAAGKDIGAVMTDVQTIGIHVDCAVSILLADHIHMALQDHGRMILHTAGSLSKEDDVVGFILNIAKSLLLGKGDNVVADGLGVMGAVGNGTKLLKIFKYSAGLQSGKSFL